MVGFSIMYYKVLGSSLGEVTCSWKELYVGNNFMALGKHCRFYLVRIEDDHFAFSSSASDDSAFHFDEAATIVESNLHALFHDLADRN